MSEDRGDRRPVVEPVAYRVDDAAEALGISRSAIYELIRSNQLRTIKHGSRRLARSLASTSSSPLPWGTRHDV